MAAITGSILIGTPHGLTSGIVPTHLALLSENSRPAWILLPVDPHHEPQERLVWIPSSPERILADALVMLALRVLHSPEVTEAVRTGLPDDDLLATRVDLSELTRYEAAARALDAALLADQTNARLAVGAFDGSSLLGQLQPLEQVSWEVEVLTTCFERFHSEWTGKTTTRGRLPEGGG